MPGSHKRRGRPEFATRGNVTNLLEWIGGGLLCLLLLATPWMYGTTLDWSIRLMNVGSFIAAGILALCAMSNFFTAQTDSGEDGSKWNSFWKYGFLILNVFVFAFCVLALYNARASFSIADQTFTYFDTYKKSLPTTYDTSATRQTLLNWSAAFCAFWALRYWILRDGGSSRASGRIRINLRFRTILWILSTNGFFISIQGILQRLSGSNELLWRRKAYWTDPAAAFGPFSYRGNAVDYINLLWPLALAAWWLLSRERRRTHPTPHRIVTDGPELLLIPAVVMMLAAAFMTLSRGGIVVAGATLVAALILLLSQRGKTKLAWIYSGAVLLAVGGLVFFLSFDKIVKRFTSSTVHTLGGRIEIYENSRKIAADYPRFGVGPGAFSSVYHLYRESTHQPWHAWVHDDWLETRVTMGWVGFTIVLLNLGFLAGWTLSSGRPAVPWIFTALVSLGLLGCLVKAKFDFPMQTYSIFYTFVAIAAILTSVSPARK